MPGTWTYAGTVPTPGPSTIYSDNGTSATLTGDNGNDIFIGTTGSDTITTGTGQNLIGPGSGNDIIFDHGSDVIFPDTSDTETIFAFGPGRGPATAAPAVGCSPAAPAART